LLVKAAKSAAQVSADDAARRGVAAMGKHEAKVKEMEQQGISYLRSSDSGARKTTFDCTIYTWRDEETDVSGINRLLLSYELKDRVLIY
jgi:hypothetical protein